MGWTSSELPLRELIPQKKRNLGNKGWGAVILSGKLPEKVPG